MRNLLTAALLVVVVAVQAQTPVIQDPPTWTQAGINYVGDDAVILQCYAPGKDYMYAVGDFSGWAEQEEFLMRKSLDGNTHWILLDNLTPLQEYRFQYSVYPGGIRVADWFADKILDPWNDQWISNDTYPGLIDFPWMDAGDPVSVFQTGQSEFVWNEGGYVRPEGHKMVIYELLLRDFITDHNWETMKDTLSYLENLGVDAIELMPFNEFDGNESWGYNPNFYFAPDKYYGTKDALKRFVEEAHQRGIAVIMDMVLNHSYGLNPQVRLYWDQGLNAPAGDNPWFNTYSPHDFGVGYDFDHESSDTRAFCKRVLQYWLEEYHVDGFRMDLSKGFTNNQTQGDLGAFNAYDQSRINILTDYANHCWGVSPGSYFILEHFADNSEESALAASGCMLWGNSNHDYGEALMGFPSNLFGISHQSRGWAFQNLVGYFSSHDEERILYNTQLYGNEFDGYSCKDEDTALERMEAIMAMFLMVPGPKMMWQFEELGYDYSINTCWDLSIDSGCRTDKKPIEWGYAEDVERKNLFKATRAMLQLRGSHPVFNTNDFNMDVGGYAKALRLYHPDMNCIVIANFDVVAQSIIPGFPYTGTWYDYMNGSAIVENNLSNPYLLQPGEYRIYIDQPYAVPDTDGSTALETGTEGCTDAAAQNYDPSAGIDDGSCLFTITLQVDMTTSAVSPLGLHVAGNFQDWSPSTTDMVDGGTGIWTYTLTAQEGDHLIYKFINGNDWPDSEIVPGGCGTDDGFGGYNRLHVVNGNATLDAHCFSDCTACPDGVIEVTFLVNMSAETVAAEGVHIGADFQGWTPGLTPMTDQGDGTWAYTATLPNNASAEWKFINGNAWGQDETVPLACADADVNLNRFASFGEDDVVVDAVCFGTCDLCPGAGQEGCTDSTACNYDPTAVTDDGSCDYTCLGCTDALACNFDVTATVDDGSCDYTCFGCTDPFACNYSSEATIDNGTCDYSCLGCTDPEADNYDPAATVDDGSCVQGSQFCGPGTIWDPELLVCVGTVTEDPCPADLDTDGIIGTGDLLELLGMFGTYCE
ncbi:MAG: alpha-amylase family glycosyl hydrolase [Flavobacteriales bacterium]